MLSQTKTWVSPQNPSEAEPKPDGHPSGTESPGQLPQRRAAVGCGSPGGTGAREAVRPLWFHPVGEQRQESG